MTPALGPELKAKIGELASHIRRRRLIRGLSLTLLVPILLFTSLFLVNLSYSLPNTALAIALGCVVVLTLATAAWCLLRPLCRPLPHTALAALIEHKYPELGEKLTTSVELASAAGPGYGSPALIALLQREAVEQTEPLDVGAAYPRRASRRLAFLALAVLGTALALGFVWEGYADFAGRFFTSWRGHKPFTIQVEYCAGFAAKGRPLTLTAHIVPGPDFRKMPDDCVLVLHGQDGSARRLPMEAGDERRFSSTMSEVAGDFEFHVEAAEVRTDTFHISAVDPVEVVDSWFEVNPPAYAGQNTRKLPATANASVLQYSDVRVQLHLTRPAVSGTLELRHSKHPDETHALELICAKDSPNARVALAALEPAEYRIALMLCAEHDITTSATLGTLTIQADTAPVFGRAAYAPRTGETATAAADDVIPLRIAVSDDVGLERVELEYYVGDAKPQTQLIASGAGQRTVEREHRFHVFGKGRAGDTIHFRVKATDNRRVAAGAAMDVAGRPVPATALNPQVAYQPALVDGKAQWFAVTIGEPPVSLHEKDLRCERDGILQAIDALTKKLRREREELQQLRGALRQHPTLLPDHATSLAAVRAINRDVSKGLEKLAQDAAKAAAPFDALADLARDVAVRQMLPADQSLTRAQDPHMQSEPRDAEFGKADQLLAEAQKRLADLKQSAERLTQDRLDQLHMERLAAREERLSKRAAELAAQKDDPQAKAELAALRAEQQRLLDELRRLTQTSSLFPKADPKDNPAQHTARKLMELTQRQGDVAKAMRAAPRADAQKQLAELSRRQQDLAQRIAEVAKELAQAKQAMSSAPLKVEPAQQAAKALQAGQLPEAHRQQQQSSAELERMAAELGEPASSGDARSAAQKLAKLQEQLRKRLMKLADSLPQLGAEAIARELGQIEREQRALAKGVEQLAVPKGKADAELSKARSETAQAADTLKRKDALAAHGHMEEAQAALERLARALPETKEKPKSAPEDKVRRAQAGQALELAKEQRMLQDEVAKLAAANAPSAEARASQRSVMQETEQPLQELRRLSQNTDSPKAAGMAQQAAAAAQNAQQAMRQAESAPDAAAAKQAAMDAQKQLESAGRQAAEAAMQFALDKKGNTPREPDKIGEAMQRGQQDAERGLKGLEAARADQAAPAMASAAQNMQQAARLAQQQLPQSGRPSPPSAKSGSIGMGVGPSVPAGILPKGFESYAGRPWGELPGELRGRLLQDMNARYGEDFARIIQGYFQDLSTAPRDRERRE